MDTMAANGTDNESQSSSNSETIEIEFKIIPDGELEKLDTDVIDATLDKVLAALPVIKAQIDTSEHELNSLDNFERLGAHLSSRRLEVLQTIDDLKKQLYDLQGYRDRINTLLRKRMGLGIKKVS
jgi:hypothetical protein